MTDINTKKDCTDVTKSFRDLISNKNQNDNDEVLGCNTKTSNDDFELFKAFVAEGNQSNIKVQQAGPTPPPPPDKSSSNNGNEAPSPSVGVPVQHDTAVLSSTASNTGVKCKKYVYVITLVVVVLIAAVALAFALKKPAPPSPLPPLSPYQPYVEVSRIIDLTSDGSEAEEDRYPYIASLKLQDGTHCCGGSLIAKDVILTAGHCLPCFDNPNPYVVLGRHNHNDDDGEEIDVSKMMRHPNYKEFFIGNIGGIENDFLLVFLEDPSTATNVRTVKLNSIASVPDEGQDVIAMGWGDTDPRDDFNLFTDDDVKFSDVLMDITLQVISSEECWNSYSGGITENMLCAKDEGQDACQGDSGGPLVVKDNDEDVQVGVISFGYGCAMDEFAGVYARVSQAYEWIQEEVCNGSTYASDAGFNCDKDEPSPITEACVFCPNGLTADGDWIPYYEYGNVYTCQDFMDYGTTVQAGSDMCEVTLKSWEPYCCPPPNPCVICPNGVSVDDNYTPFSATYGDQTTCGEIMSAASSFEAGSDWCIVAYDACCLPQTEVTTAPTVLPTTAPTLLPSTVEVISFMSMSMSMSITVSPSETLTIAPTTSSFFSPTSTSFPEPCFICQEGRDYGGDDYCSRYPLSCNAPADEDYKTTCKEIVELYSQAFYNFDSSPEECGKVDEYELFCCPTVVSQNPCTICPNGVTVSEGEDFQPYAVAGADHLTFWFITIPNYFTCGELIDAAQQYVTGSTECAQFDVHELYCCPTIPDDNCVICPNGATAGDSFIPLQNATLTCAQLIDIAAKFERESSYCEVFGAIDEEDCCS